MTATAHVVVVAPEDAGERLDKVLARHLASRSVTRSMVASCFERGTVRVDGATPRPADRLRAGTEVRVELPAPPPSTALPEAIALDVVYEDEHLLVINKPAGMVVHPARGHAGGTLVNAVLHRTPVEDSDPVRPGIVHRIDRDTSGLLVVARTVAAREGLAALFKRHDIERTYLAIVEGVAPAEVTYDTLHGRHPVDRKRYSGRVAEGRRAVTHTALVETFGDGVASLLRCRLETGRTHQIRVHLSEAGHPLLADAAYGRTPRDPALRAVALALGRHALHATTLGFTHPVTRAALHFEAPLPDDLRAALAALRTL